MSQSDKLPGNLDRSILANCLHGLDASLTTEETSKTINAMNRFYFLVTRINLVNDNATSTTSSPPRQLDKFKSDILVTLARTILDVCHRKVFTEKNVELVVEKALLPFLLQICTEIETNVPDDAVGLPYEIVSDSE